MILFFSIVSKMGCGESLEGVAVGADMYYKENIKAFIGPYCNTGKIMNFYKIHC